MNFKQQTLTTYTCLNSSWDSILDLRLSTSWLTGHLTAVRGMPSVISGHYQHGGQVFTSQ